MIGLISPRSSISATRASLAATWGFRDARSLRFAASEAVRPGSAVRVAVMVRISFWRREPDRTRRVPTGCWGLRGFSGAWLGTPGSGKNAVVSALTACCPLSEGHDAISGSDYGLCDLEGQRHGRNRGRDGGLIPAFGAAGGEPDGLVEGRPQVQPQLATRPGRCWAGRCCGWAGRWSGRGCRTGLFARRRGRRGGRDRRW
jgi:hypothetical protein